MMKAGQVIVGFIAIIINANISTSSNHQQKTCIVSVSALWFFDFKYLLIVKLYYKSIFVILISTIRRRSKLDFEVAAESAVVLIRFDQIQNVVFVVNSLVKFRSPETMLAASKKSNHIELSPAKAFIFQKIKMFFSIKQIAVRLQSWQNWQYVDNQLRYVDWLRRIKSGIVIIFPDPIEIDF